MRIYPISYCPCEIPARAGKISLLRGERFSLACLMLIITPLIQEYATMINHNPYLFLPLSLFAYRIRSMMPILVFIGTSLYYPGQAAQRDRRDAESGYQRPFDAL